VVLEEIDLVVPSRLAADRIRSSSVRSSSRVIIRRWTTVSGAVINDG
jgi:hypothetical protein